ncbi:hypothetical protein [Siphonobacter sp. SORGH_AS_1065]|uniref:hypothetical protein n=1 Tax=Siphonobacter sp. SORGH_AS_1065 TaxID=3041795 RepID=UPI00278AE85E|nr:hypothetical protein [Siphonobacter sp. SORGH_AS_1065]MDQ1089310.1 hypothetical protein [Siphonobacter sp. SORGH_AS_1065]
MIPAKKLASVYLQLFRHKTLAATDASLFTGFNHPSHHLFIVTLIPPTHDASEKAGIGIP